MSTPISMAAVDFVDETGDDFHLDTTDDVALAKGADLSNDPYMQSQLILMVTNEKETTQSEQTKEHQPRYTAPWDHPTPELWRQDKATT